MLAREGDLAPTVTNPEGEARNVSLDGELFSLEVYGPNEVEHIANSAPEQLALLDKFALADVRRVSAEIVNVERRITESAEARARVHAEIAEDEQRVNDLPTVREALAALQQASGPDAEEMRAAHRRKSLRGKEGAELSHLEREIVLVRSALDQVAAEATRRLRDAVLPELENEAHGDLFRPPLLTGERGEKEERRSLGRVPSPPLVLDDALEQLSWLAVERWCCIAAR